MIIITLLHFKGQDDLETIKKYLQRSIWIRNYDISEKKKSKLLVSDKVPFLQVKFILYSSQNALYLWFVSI